MYIIKQYGNATLASNTGNKNKEYNYVRVVELGDVDYTFSICDLLKLKENHADYYIDTTIIPEIKKVFWKSVLKHGESVKYLENKLYCGIMRFQGYAYNIIANKSEDYIEQSVLNMGTIFRISINSELNNISKNIKTIEYHSWDTLQRNYYEWCEISGFKNLKQEELDIVKDNMIFSYLEKDLYQFIAKVFKTNETAANRFYEYMEGIHKGIQSIAGEIVSPLNKLKYRMYNKTFQPRLHYNHNLMIYEKKCIVNKEALREIRRFIKECIPTLGILVDYVEVFRREIGVELLCNETKQTEEVENYFFYWFFKINRRYINQR